MTELFHLYSLDLTDIGGGFYFFHQYNYGEISFDGSIYTAMPIECDGFEVSSKGLPTPTIRVSNVLGEIGQLVRQYDGLQGAKLKRLTLKKQAEGHLYTAADLIGNFEIYIIDRPTSHTSISIAFELVSPFALNRNKLPKGTILQRCSLVYGGAECGISITPTYPTCPRTVDDCFARTQLNTGEPNPAIPYKGFPSVNKYLT